MEGGGAGRGPPDASGPTPSGVASALRGFCPAPLLPGAAAASGAAAGLAMDGDPEATVVAVGCGWMPGWLAAGKFAGPIGSGPIGPVRPCGCVVVGPVRSGPGA